MQRNLWCALFGLGVIVTGCRRAKEGGPCDAKAEPVCRDENAALVCRNGAWEAVACSGSCAGKGDDLRCDPGEVTEGTPCLYGFHLDESMQSTYACGVDGKFLAECVAGRWKREKTCACRTHWHEGLTYHTQYVTCGQ